ncbi:uncharacterized protein LOC107360764, partial [Tetranychus urticae]|uniref:uncharacterized protein LOC107360764 n=1 Tax=Tetranychus urticae TaxID=32264 RepID=UPI00077BDEC3
MPRGSSLSDYEKGQIDSFKTQGLSIRQIAAKITRSPRVVFNYLNAGENYSASPRSGRPAKFDDRDKRSVLRLMDEGNKSCKQVLEESSLPVSVKTINRAIEESGFYEYDSMDVKPRLTDEHK